MQASNTMSSLELIVHDMELPHEGQPSGVPEYYSWVLGPEIVLGNNPGEFTAITAWGQVYTDTSGSVAQNTRVQIRNIKTYVLSQTTGIWQEVQSSVGVEGAAYREDYVDNINVPADVRNEADGSISVKLTSGYAYHFWPLGGRATIDPTDIGGVFTTVEARLIVDNPALPDDRSQARLMMSMGGDYWQDTTAPWDYFKTSGAIAGGRFRYIDSEWDTFNMTTLTKDALYSNPPPIAPAEDTPIAPLTIQAESITNISGYRLESNGAASDGSMLSLVGGSSNETGTATFAFTGATGAYRVVLGTFDENDGIATLQLSKNGSLVGSVVLNQNRGSIAATTATKVERIITSGLTLATGDSLTITGFENASEHARFDFIRFESFDSFSPLTSVPAFTDEDDQSLPPLIWEAEQATPLGNYRIEDIGDASGGQVLSFLNGDDNEIGSATFGFNEAPGNYTIILGTFDENDGLASFNVSITDVETGTTTTVGSLALNANLGSAIANAQTKISATVATGIALTPGDTITVTGFENALEHARLDFLQLVPTI